VTSTNGSTRLAMQTDGNLVLYNGAGQASLSVWHVHAQAPQRSCRPTEISSSTAGPEHRPGRLGCTAPAHTSSFRTTGTPALKFDRDSAVGRVGIYGELWGASHLRRLHPQVISHGVAQHPAGPFGKNQPTPRLPRTTRLRRTQGERGRVTRPWRSPLCNRREPWPRNLRDLDRGGPPPRACATDVRFRRRAIGIHRTAHSRSLPMQHCGPHLPSLSSSAAGSSSDPARGSPPSSSFGPGGPPATRTRRLLRLTA
jgi:hypothetical protein